jgi:molybdopterin-guanine dinucleotide biosynthesis protein A
MKTSRELRVESRAQVPAASGLPFSAVILAGGKSSRMGRDKAWLKIGGKTLLARQIELVRAVGASEVFISGRPGTDYAEFGGRVLPDHFKDAGPLAGVERALDATTTTLLLVLAVDMPTMTANFLEKLRAASTENLGTVPQVDGRIEPLAAFYPKTAGPLAVEMLRARETGSEAGAPGPTDFARRCEKENLVKLIAVDETEARCFTNLNAPEDLNRCDPKVDNR